jgi:hypothetical protein
MFRFINRSSGSLPLFDATLYIARRFTTRIFEHSWKADFSEAGNIFLANADSEWTLF